MKYDSIVLKEIQPFYDGNGKTSKIPHAKDSQTYWWHELKKLITQN